MIYNTEKTRLAITREQMNKFLKFIHDDNIYCKYYEAIYILFHTGMRISEFCGLTLKDLDLENRIIDINHQVQRSDPANTTSAPPRPVPEPASCR